MLKAFQTAVNLQKWDLERQSTLLAVSGGIDSVAMARMFAQSGFPFAIAHVNFGLRGRESEKDEAFVLALGLELGVEVFVDRVNVSEYRKQNGVSVQMAARALRYGFFHRLMREKGFAKLATAHHANDNLEHFFVYLHRNNSAVAWRGIWMSQDDVIRPLLLFLKCELEQYLVSGGWTWREDRSNLSVGYLRNKIRHFITPGLDDYAKEFYKLSLANQNLHRGRILADEILWQRFSEQKLGGFWVANAYVKSGDTTDVIHRFMSMGFSRNQIMQALAAKQAGKRFDGKENSLWIGRDGWMILAKDLTSPAAIVMVWQHNWSIRWGEYCLTLEWVEELIDGFSDALKDIGNTSSDGVEALAISGASEKQASGHGQVYYFCEEVSQRNWVLRGWVNGDAIDLFGGHRKKLSDLFVNEKIETFAKPFVPVIAGVEGVLCAVGVRRSAMHTLKAGVAGCWALRWEWVNDSQPITH